MKPVRHAVIDIGTNTILLLVVETRGSEAARVLVDRQELPRLGKGVDENKVILPDAFDRCERALRAHLDVCRALAVEKIAVTGTSALRDAVNRNEFTAAMHARLGISIEILSGDDEALWMYIGTVTGFNVTDRSAAILDIGGGSTELTIGFEAQIHERRSLDIGSVRLTEKYLRRLPPHPDDIRALQEFLSHEIVKYPRIPEGSVFIGIAGTVTTLAAIELGLPEYDPDAISGFLLRRDRIRHWMERFFLIPRSKMLEIVQMDPGRADIILAGVMILHSIMENRGIAAVCVSDRGLRYGIAIRELQKEGYPTAIGSKRDIGTTG